MTFFYLFVPLVGKFIAGFGAYIISFIAAGLLFASPYIIREIIDYV